MRLKLIYRTQQEDFMAFSPYIAYPVTPALWAQADMREIKSGAEITKCSDIQAEEKSWTQKGHLQSAGMFIIKQIKKPYEQNESHICNGQSLSSCPWTIGFCGQIQFQIFYSGTATPLRLISFSPVVTLGDLRNLKANWLLIWFMLWSPHIRPLPTN